MKEKISKILTIVLRYVAVFLFGAVLGIIFVIIFAEPLLRASINKDVGLGIIALAPILIVYYSIFFGTIGGIIGIVIYKLRNKYKKHLNSVNKLLDNNLKK